MKCFYCREDSRTYKKKLALPQYKISGWDSKHNCQKKDRTYQYCEKEFIYPSILKRHLKLKNMCSKQISLANDRISLASDRVSQASDRISLTSNQISEKNMVPIWLTLV